MSLIISNKFQPKKKNLQFQCKIYKSKKSQQRSPFVPYTLLYEASYKGSIVANRMDYVSKPALLRRFPAILWSLSCMFICNFHQKNDLREKKILFEARKKELCKNVKISLSRDSHDRISCKQIIINKRIPIRLQESQEEYLQKKKSTVELSTTSTTLLDTKMGVLNRNKEPTRIVTNAQSNLKYSSGNSFLTKSFITLPFLSPGQLETLFKAGIWPSRVAP